MFVPNSRQPLLPASRRRALRQQVSTAAAKQPFSPLIWLIFTVIAVSLIFSHLFLPSIRDKETSTQQPLDSEHELYTLYHEPSPHFCSLNRRPNVCAHGGNIDDAPPNTIAAFEAALDADCVEVDVSMTKDGQLVALHDRDLAALLNQRNSGGSLEARPGVVETSPSMKLSTFWNRKLAHRSPSDLYPRTGDYTWDQLSQLQWERDGSGIALVKDVLDLILSSPLELSLTLDIKLKDSIKETLEAELMAQAVYDLLKETNCGQYCMTWSKSDIFTTAMKNLDHRQRVGLIVLNETSAARTAGMHDPLRLEYLKTEVAGVHYRMATAELTRVLKKAGKEVYIWTANTAAMMQIALDAGPDAIVTSYPRKLLGALHARAAACGRRRRRDPS